MDKEEIDVSAGLPRRAQVITTVSLVSLCGSLLVVAPSSAAPDPGSLRDRVESVQARVDSLYHQAEQASERYDSARIRLTSAEHRLQRAQTVLRRQQTRVAVTHRQVAVSVVAQYQGQGISSATQVLMSSNPQDFLDKLSTVAQFDDQRSQLMSAYVAQAKLLQVRQAVAGQQVDRISKTKQSLGKDKAEIDKKAAEAKKLLGRLKQRVAARAEEASRSADRTGAAAASAAGTIATPVSAPASGRAAAAVRYAMAQVGHPYVYGAAGPSAFDCSGLTMRAWGAAGVGLPHSSSAQTGSGTRISQSQLQPGDLVFYYSPVSHVGMYIGNGLIVNAENPSVGVKITGVNSMPYAGAVRPG